MVRTPSCDKTGLRKGTWAPDEDRKLIDYVTRYGCWNWRQLPRFAGLARCGKSCRLRWMNYLRPNIKRGNYTQEEEEIIIRMHKNLGNRWSAIAAHLPGRTDNEIKNHWHTNLKRRIHQHNSATNKKTQISKSKDSSLADNGSFQGTSVTPQIPDSCPLSPQSSSSCTTTETTSTLQYDFAFLDAYTEPMSGNFWTEPNMADISYVPTEIRPINDTCQTPATTQIPDTCASSTESLVVEDDFAFLDARPEAAFENFWTDPYLANMSPIPTESETPLVTEFEYHFPVYDLDLWSQSNLYEETISLF